MARYYFLPQRLQKAVRLPQRLVWWVEYIVIGGLIELFKRLPIRLSMRFAAFVFGLFGPYTPRADKVRGNLTVAFPQTPDTRLEELMRDSYRHLGVAIAELASLKQIWRERERRIEFTLEPGAVMPTPDKRSVFVTAHLGAWQLTPLIGPHYGVTLPVIYAPEQNPLVDRKLGAMRRAFGGPLVSRDGGIRVLMRALDQGQSIGLTADTRMDAGESLPFFDEPAMTNTAPARLALRYDCDLVPVLAERLPGARYRVKLFAPIRARADAADRQARVQDMTGQLNRLFEQWIRDRPDQWLCLKRRWPKAVYKRLQAR
ncbi:lysophospholipid acyltransferase family protein [Salinisphaera aquimarina]|uniref:Lysophospholipid acyltransferase family protein n=1 Tax=Salinisphaera aquimarina TaxID=2094031 RepID=A0ABV7EKM1_9GAMM